jgi:hypothetical protein
MEPAANSQSAGSLP